MTTPAATARVRWEENQYGNHFGYVGAMEHLMFRIDRPVLAGQRWMLTAFLGWIVDVKSGADPDLLKAEAERWLGEFVSSLGAAFPAQGLTRDQLTEALSRLGVCPVVTRFEVIDHTTDGKELVSYSPDIARSVVAYGVKVKLSFQDDGQTLKVFLADPAKEADQ